MKAEFEFIYREEFNTLKKDRISSFKTRDGYHMGIFSSTDPGDIILAYEDERQMPNEVWRMIAVLPPKEASMTDIVRGGYPSTLMVLNGPMVDSVVFIENEGIMAIGTEFDATVPLEVEDEVSSMDLRDFFNGIGAIMCDSLMDKKKESDE